MKKPPLIRKEMLVSDVVKNYPETIPLFLQKGLHCIGCAFAKDETLEEAAGVHQINLDEFLEALNKKVKK